jgi:hypothetical protein
MVGGATPRVADGPPLLTVTRVSAKFARGTQDQGIITVSGTKAGENLSHLCHSFC